MRWTKTSLSLLLSFALISSTISLGWSVVNAERSDTVIHALHVCFALYVFLLAVRSIGQDNPNDHSDSILHLTTLLTVVFLLLGSAAILPSTRPPIVTSIEDGYILLGLWYGLVGIYGIACFIAYTTPLGPPLHYPPSDIYSEKTVQSITNTDEENVCGIISMFLSFFAPLFLSTHADGSPWDILLFSYTTKVVWLGNLAESLEIGDLPIVTADMRATYNYARMKKALREINLRVFSWSPTPGSGWLLAYRLVRLNYVAFTAELLLAAVSAVLYYSPPFFLQKLVKYLEVDPQREQPGWGWVFVLGLFFANVVSFIGKSLSFPVLFPFLTEPCSHWTTLVIVYHDNPGSTEDSTQHDPLWQNTRQEGRGVLCTSTAANCLF